MGNNVSLDKNVKVNINMSNAFQNILKSPSQIDMNSKLNTLLNGKYEQSEWIGSITSEDIRQYYHEHCDNVDKILQFAIEFLFDTAKGYPKELSKEHINALNNCLRVVVKVIPVVYEKEDRMNKLLWHCENLNYSLQNLQVNNNNRLKIIRSNDQEIENKLQNNVSWGIKLIQSLQTLCFYPSYTILPQAELQSIPKESGLGQQFDNKCFWASILSNIPHPNSTNKYDENRMLVLSSILTCMSSTLFTPSYGQNYLNPWISFLTSPLNKQNGTFFMNLLFYFLSFKSQVLNRNTYQTSKRIALIASQIVYSILCHQPNKETVNDILEVNFGLQQINDFLQEQAEVTENTAIETSFVLSNEILHYLSIQKEEESNIFLKEISERLLALLEEPLENENSLFVNSLKELQFTEEAFGILQQLLYYSPALYKHVCCNNKLLYRLFKVSIFQFCKSLDQMVPNNTYFVSMCLLTILSNNTSFSYMLNQPKDFNINLRNFPIVDGTLADLLVSCCAQAIINHQYNQNICHPFNLMTILKNVSPYLRGLSQVSCQKLNQLVTLFTQMNFLVQSHYSPFCIVKLLQMYDYILGCNMSTNLCLVFEIYQRQEIFTRIPKINFHPNTLRAYYKQLKEKQNSQSVSPPQQQQQQHMSSSRSNQKIEELSQDIENMQKKKQTQNEDKQLQEEIILKDKAEELNANQEAELNNSSRSKTRKAPKRVVKKKKEQLSVNVSDQEKASLSKQAPPLNKNDEQEEKKENIGQEQEDEEEKKEPHNQSENESDEKEGKREAIEIVIQQKSPEDQFVERWDQFDWVSIYKTIPLGNLSTVLKNVNEFINTSMKKSRYEITFEVFSKEKSFINGLHKTMKPNVDIVLEQFTNFRDILALSSQCCWMQILTKSALFPAFENSQIRFFRADIPPIDLNMNNQSINVEFQSSNNLTQPK